jgi:hypothetical protein
VRRLVPPGAVLTVLATLGAIGPAPCAADPPAARALVVGVSFTAPDVDVIQLKAWLEESLLRQFGFAQVRAELRRGAESTKEWIGRVGMTHLLEGKVEERTAGRLVWYWQVSVPGPVKNKPLTSGYFSLYATGTEGIDRSSVTHVVDEVAAKLVNRFLAEFNLARPRMIYTACFRGQQSTRWRAEIKSRLRDVELGMPWRLPQSLKSVLQPMGFDVVGIRRDRVEAWCEKGGPKELEDERSKADLVIEGGTEPDEKDELNRFILLLVITPIRGNALPLEIRSPDGRHLETVNYKDVVKEAVQLIHGRWPEVEKALVVPRSP